MLGSLCRFLVCWFGRELPTFPCSALSVAIYPTTAKRSAIVYGRFSHQWKSMSQCDSPTKGVMHYPTYRTASPDTKGLRSRRFNTWSIVSFFFTSNKKIDFPRVCGRCCHFLVRQQSALPLGARKDDDDPLILGELGNSPLRDCTLGRPSNSVPRNVRSLLAVYPPYALCNIQNEVLEALRF